MIHVALQWFPEMLTKSLHWNSKDDVGAVHHFVQEIRAKGNLPLMVKNYTIQSNLVTKSLFTASASVQQHTWQEQIQWSLY